MSEPVPTVDPQALLAHAGWVRSLAARLVLDPDRVDDVVQEAWLQIVRRPPRHSANLPAWLRRVVTNTARQLGRGDGRRLAREAAAGPPREPAGPEVLADEAEQARQVVAAVLELEEPYRSTVLLRFHLDRSPREIAAQQGVPPGTVRSRIHRALEQLRDRLDGEHDGDRRAWSLGLLPLAARASRAPVVGASALVLGVKLMLGLAVGAAATALVWKGVAGEPEARGTTQEVAALAVDELSTPASEAGEPAAASELDVEQARRPAAALAEAPAYVGRVLAADDSPVVGARVEFRRRVGDWREQPTFAEGFCDAEGRLRVEARPPEGVPVLAYVTAPGFVPASIDPIVPGSEFEIRPQWLGELRGRVLDAETDRPLPGLAVHFQGKQTISGPGGVYSLEDVPVGPPAEAFVFGAEYPLHAIEVELSGPDASERDLRVRPGQGVRFEVFDRETGRPIAGAEVRRRPGEPVLATSDASGAFVLPVLERTLLQLTVSAPGCTHFRWSTYLRDLERPRIPLLRLAWLEGMVVDGVDAPVAGAWVTLHCERQGYGRWFLTEEEREALSLPGNPYYEVPPELARPSGEDGRYRVAAIPNEGEYSASAGHRDYATCELAGLHLATGGAAARLDFVLRAGATVRGRVLQNGEPWTQSSVFWSDASGEVGGASRIDEQGRFLLENIRAGTVELRLRKHAVSGADPRVTLEVEAGREYEQDLAWTMEMGTIRGRVTDARGEPVEGEDVTGASENDRAWGSALSGPDGEYVLELPAPHLYSVSVRREDFSDRRSGVRLGSTGVDLVVPDVGGLLLRLVDAATGEEVGSRVGDLYWRRSDEEIFRPLSGNLRRSPIELRMPVGDVDLIVDLSEDGYLPHRLQGLAVGREAAAPLVVGLERGHELELSLAGEPMDEATRRSHLFFLLEESELDAVRGPFEGQGPQSNHRINGILMWLSEPGLTERMPRFDGGIALLRGLPPGRYSLRAFPDDLVFEPGSFELPRPGGEGGDRIELTWRRR